MFPRFKTIKFLFQIWHGSQRCASKKRDQRNDQYSQGMAQRTQEEPVPDQRREDHARDHHQDDADAGLHMVREREEKIEEGEQDDLGAEEQGGGRR